MSAQPSCKIEQRACDLYNDCMAGLEDAEDKLYPWWCDIDVASKEHWREIARREMQQEAINEPVESDGDR